MPVEGLLQSVFRRLPGIDGAFEFRGHVRRHCQSNWLGPTPLGPCFLGLVTKQHCQSKSARAGCEWGFRKGRLVRVAMLTATDARLV